MTEWGKRILRINGLWMMIEYSHIGRGGIWISRMQWNTPGTLDSPRWICCTTGFLLAPLTFVRHPLSLSSPSTMVSNSALVRLASHTTSSTRYDSCTWIHPPSLGSRIAAAVSRELRDVGRLPQFTYLTGGSESLKLWILANALSPCSMNATTLVFECTLTFLFGTWSPEWTRTCHPFLIAPLLKPSMLHGFASQQSTFWAPAAAWLNAKDPLPGARSTAVYVLGPFRAAAADLTLNMCSVLAFSVVLWWWWREAV
jgi:hypothetical protein